MRFGNLVSLLSMVLYAICIWIMAIAIGTIAATPFGAASDITGVWHDGMSPSILRTWWYTCSISTGIIGLGILLTFWFGSAVAIVMRMRTMWTNGEWTALMKKSDADDALKEDSA